ncbi:MAG: antibiotic biosynthesis monooxygenase [Oscillospiraceae bacterium]|jgi:quinol monooxygenase YgiN|nr:antibiotic biosynthesis monooxygenase [Oscillospiraceae bacterium]
MSIRVIAENKVKPEKLGEFFSVVLELIEKTHAFDDGCIQYELFESDDGGYTMLEEWASREALQAHSSSQHFLELIPKLGACCEPGGAPKILSGFVIPRA